LTAILVRPPCTFEQPDVDAYGELSRFVTTPTITLPMEQGRPIGVIHSVVTPPGVSSIEGPFFFFFFNFFLQGLTIVNNSPTSTLYLSWALANAVPIVNPDFFAVRLSPMASFVEPFPASGFGMSGLWTDPIVVVGDAQITQTMLLI
jgi:hypothetical protein